MKKALFGNGGHSKEIRCYFDFDVDIFVDEQLVDDDTISISEFDPSEYEIMIAIGDSLERKKVVKNLPPSTKFFSYIHPTSIISGNVKIGEGHFIGPNCILTTNIIIGDHLILNRGNQIGHDSVIGDFFSAMPGAIVSGNNVVGNNVYLGSNSTTKEKIHITDSVKIGLNSGVTKNINISGSYVGTPAALVKNKI